MSTIYSAGQYDDAFSPKRLGNWESTAKESVPFLKPHNRPHSLPKIISDSRGHLFPWVPRAPRSSSWGLLNVHLRNKYQRSHTVLMSGPGKQPNASTPTPQQRRLKRLPKFCPRKLEEGPPPDLLLEYLQHLRLPIIWILGPPTRATLTKRRAFCRQLASSLGFGYVCLDDKVAEWKERQQVCTCANSVNHDRTIQSPPDTPPGPLHSLASTSIAPCKLPTSVPPFISPNIPPPPDSATAADANAYLLSILESQLISFDTALPLSRQKILELYKFAMAECLPCGGFILDGVPFDLVEGLQFEKIFYPAALAIYFSEGVPQRNKRLKPKDRRITACGSSAVTTATLDYLEHKQAARRPSEQNVYLRSKSHKRLGVFSPAEGDKLCRQFGGKTIRIINAEDVEGETIAFLNELVRRNLDRYEDILQGKAKLDFGGELISGHHADVRSPPITTYSQASFLLEEEEQRMRRAEEAEEEQKAKNLPPPLVTADESDSSLLTLPNIFKSVSDSGAESVSSSARLPEGIAEEKPYHLEDGSGDQCHFPPVPASPEKEAQKGRQSSAEIWERIVKLESKVADLRPLEPVRSITPEMVISFTEDPLPPPTAYQEEEAEENPEIYTTAIRNAIGSVAYHEAQDKILAADYDYGAGGDSAGVQPAAPQRKGSKNWPPNNNNNYTDDPFYDYE